MMGWVLSFLLAGMAGAASVILIVFLAMVSIRFAMPLVRRGWGVTVVTAEMQLSEIRD